MLEQAVGETAGGTANIGTDPAVRVHLQGQQTGLEFFAAATHITPSRPERNPGADRDQGTGLVAGSPVNNYPAGADQPNRLVEGFRQAAFNEQTVQSLFSRPAQGTRYSLPSRSLAWAASGLLPWSLISFL